MITIKLNRIEQAILLELLNDNCCGMNPRKARIASDLYDKIFHAGKQQNEKTKRPLTLSIVKP